MSDIEGFLWAIHEGDEWYDSEYELDALEHGERVAYEFAMDRVIESWETFLANRTN